MTNDDRLAALSLAGEQRVMGLNSNGEKVNIGGLLVQRSDGSHPYCAMFAGYLWQSNGTITWDPDDSAMGLGSFGNIYEYIAAEMYSPAPGFRGKIEAADAFAKSVRTSVQGVATWLESNYGVTLFRISVTKNLVTTITVHPDLEVRAAKDGAPAETAVQNQKRRDTAMVEGQVSASYRRIGRTQGEKTAQEMLKKAVQSLLDKPLDIPVRKRITLD